MYTIIGLCKRGVFVPYVRKYGYKAVWVNNWGWYAPSDSGCFRKKVSGRGLCPAWWGL